MRTKLLILASSIGMLGWGTVLPYQYAYAANTRGWGALAAALASTLFSVGALVAAPFAGRLSDRFDPVTVAVAAKLLAAIGVGSLVWATTAPAFLSGMFVFGLGLTAAGPAASVLVLRWTPSDDRRKVFAYKFTGEAIGMAVGAFVAGQFVDLDRADGMVLAFVAAGLGFAVSAALVHVAGLGAPADLAPELAAGRGRDAAAHARGAAAHLRRAGTALDRGGCRRAGARLLRAVRVRPARLRPHRARRRRGLDRPRRRRQLRRHRRPAGRRRAADGQAWRGHPAHGRRGHLDPVVGRALGGPVHARGRRRPLRHDVRHLRRRRDDVRPGAQPADGQPRTEGPRRHDARAPSRRSRRRSRHSARSWRAPCSGSVSRRASSACTCSSASPPCMPRGACAPPCGRATGGRSSRPASSASGRGWRAGGESAPDRATGRVHDLLVEPARAAAAA